MRTSTIHRIQQLNDIPTKSFRTIDDKTNTRKLLHFSAVIVVAKLAILGKLRMHKHTHIPNANKYQQIDFEMS